MEIISQNGHQESNLDDLEEFVEKVDNDLLKLENQQTKLKAFYRKFNRKSIPI